MFPILFGQKGNAKATRLSLKENKILLIFERVGNFIFIPLPLASLPMFAFLLLGIYGKVIWLIVSAIIIGVGHMGIHIHHNCEIKNKEFSRINEHN